MMKNMVRIDCSNITDWETFHDDFAQSLRVSDLLCMSNSVHASSTKEHEDNDDYEGSIRRAA